jgi:Ca2+-transporting ATPase
MQSGTCFDDTAITVSLCPGRARIKVPRLFRSAAEKDRIEAAIAAQEHVAAVHANPLTGNVLILFDVLIDPGSILIALGLTFISSSQDVLHEAPQPEDHACVRRPAKQKKQNTGNMQTREIYPPWHMRAAHAALACHQSSQRSGLTSPIVEQRLHNGLNLLPQKRTNTSLELLLNQFKSLPVLLLGVSAVLSLLTGGIPEAIAIAAVLAMNGGIGFVTERRAASSIALLSELIDDTVPVLRDESVVETQASHVVPGDILVLAPGVHIAADARLVQVSGLMIDESALTGESRFVAKGADALSAPVALADRTNMAYMGTAVTAGSGLAVVVGTGANTKCVKRISPAQCQFRTACARSRGYAGSGACVPCCRSGHAPQDIARLRNDCG